MKKPHKILAKILKGNNKFDENNKKTRWIN